MRHEQWLGFIQSAVGDMASYTGRTSQWVVLTAEHAQEDLARAEQVLHRPLPQAARIVLEQWKGQGASVLLETVPRALNPNRGLADLNPTGASMAELFPAFCTMLERTEEVAIIVDAASESEVLVGGAANQTPPPGHQWAFSPDGRRMWAYYLPRSLEDLLVCEAGLGVRLSPQMRQMYLRVGGMPNDLLDPSFYRPEMLRKGALYNDLYREITDQVPLAEAVIERQQAFVILTDEDGDFVGFFADEERLDGEYTIYQWDHGALEFRPWAPDFAGFVHRFLT